MGAQVSEEVERWASVGDLAAIAPRMRVIRALPVPCQVEVVRRLWRNSRWVPPGEVLVMTSDFVDRFIVLIAGEAEVLLGNRSCIWMVPSGTFFCEVALLDWRGVKANGLQAYASPAWALRRWRRISAPAARLVEDFLKRPLHGPRFHGQVRAARRSLVATLTRSELLEAAEVHGAQEAVLGLDALPVSCNVFRNVATFAAPTRDMDAKDIAALRLVCEGPLLSTCRGAVVPDLRGQASGLFSCCAPAVPPAELDESSERIAQ